MAKGGRSFQISAAPVAVFAQLLVISIATLVLVWLLKFREGLAFKSHIKAKIFNATIIVYKTIPAKRQAQKATHLILHLIALVAGIIGVYAVFKFHNEIYLPNMYTLHSWIGLSTICLFGLQVTGCQVVAPANSPDVADGGAGEINGGGRWWRRRNRRMWEMVAPANSPDFADGAVGEIERRWEVGGIHLAGDGDGGGRWLLAFFSFAFPGADSSRRSKMVPWHVFFGIVIFFMTIVTAETGLTQRFLSLGLQRTQEALIVNFTGLLILLLGISVGFIIILPRRM
ncbi:hypothetical protein OSB04_018086 [Centaurea solstitialis]|uniref:Cytochrome b561 domain-containing protein n=1 Tax=Centaurea solstitialis TaxID=347529 RepID=A0AA38THB8_9ASTR|nr:hypothetical protein OSB04_018086 [Centaurea solstitialis]